ncbi:MAG: class I SAM-dependent methyltransferase, partial [Nanoarchaeota archaeon]|nr:class I SAM-dependent methyltransferase [Nanoarchaeota archaeon]
SIDIDKDNLDRAREILPELNFLYANAQKKLPFENREFDVVVMTEVLEHLKDERLILKEIRRVLKKNGALVLSVPKRRWFNIFSPITHVQHIREYCEKRIIQTLEKNGFSVRMMFVGGTFLEIVNLWIHLLLKYGLGHVSPDIFFGKVIDKTYKRGFKGAGFDIILRAELSSSL